jgi:hypothetical protein
VGEVVDAEEVGSAEGEVDVVHDESDLV